MNTTDLVHFVSTGERSRPTTAAPARPIPYHELVTPLRLGILRARQYLMSERRADGTWQGRLASDASLVSQWVFLLAYRGEEHGERGEAAAQTILDLQLPGGGWSRLPGGAVDLNTSVQAYFALKLAGYDPSDHRLAKARDVIRALGGADATDITTRYFLALFGQIDYESCPVIVPEQWLFNRGRQCQFASLAVLWSHRIVRDVGLAGGVRELFVNQPADWSALHVTRRQRLTAAILSFCERRGWTPLRRRALNRLEALLFERVAPAQLVELSFPELVRTLIALDTLGHAENESFRVCDQRIRELIVCEDRAGRAWPQLRTSRLGDTALTYRAIQASGIPLRQLACSRAASWLARQQLQRLIRNPLETAWLLKLLHAASGAAGEADAALPPDLQVDQERLETIGIVRSASLERRAVGAAQRIIRHLLSQQNADGGWSSAGRSVASSPDVTAGVLESLAKILSEPASRPSHRTQLRRATDAAVAYLRSTQRADGSWSSATGVEFIHGTSLAICGLLAAGVPAEDDTVAAGVNWLVVHQQAVGGWGESPSSLSDIADYTAGTASASQTAWALHALIAAGLTGEEPARRAAQFLLDTQEDDGRWHEPHFTLHDVETGHWYRNDLHTAAWPLAALSEWAVAAARSAAVDQISLRLVGMVEGE